jgi:hypothetical protein
MQLFCAVAPVPRQEDFGIVDAVATLLRREGRLLYAEDSFSVQFKSRTEKVLEYLDKRFEALLKQELSLFIAHVDINAAEINLYSVGAVLLHANINEMRGLVLYLDPVEQRCEDGVLHTSLGNPGLKWTAAHLADRDFEQKSYVVMKRWLELDRWNRRYRKMGMQTEIQWKTNEVPSQGAKALMWNPARAEEALAEVVPAVQMIAGLVTSDVSLAEPVLRLMDWMRDRGVEPDPSGTLGLMAIMRAGGVQLVETLKKHGEADIAAQFIDIRNTPNSLAFWVQSADREGRKVARREEGSVVEIRARGFDVDADPDSQRIIDIRFGTLWLKERNCEIVGKYRRVVLLRRSIER